MNKIISAILLLCLVGLSTSQVQQVQDQLNQYAADLTDAQIERAKDAVLNSAQVQANEELIPYVNNASEIAQSLVNSAEDDGNSLTDQAADALIVGQNGDNTIVQLSGGNATLTFNNLTNDDVTALENAYEDFSRNGNVTQTAQDLEDILANKNEDSAVAITALLNAFFESLPDETQEDIENAIDNGEIAVGGDNGETESTVEAEATAESEVEATEESGETEIVPPVVEVTNETEATEENVEEATAPVKVCKNNRRLRMRI